MKWFDELQTLHRVISQSEKEFFDALEKEMLRHFILKDPLRFSRLNVNQLRQAKVQNPQTLTSSSFTLNSNVYHVVFSSYSHVNTYPIQFPMRKTQAYLYTQISIDNSEKGECSEKGKLIILIPIDTKYDYLKNRFSMTTLCFSTPYYAMIVASGYRDTVAESLTMLYGHVEFCRIPSSRALAEKPLAEEQWLPCAPLFISQIVNVLSRRSSHILIALKIVYEYCLIHLLTMHCYSTEPDQERYPNSIDSSQNGIELFSIPDIINSALIGTDEMQNLFYRLFSNTTKPLGWSASFASRARVLSSNFLIPLKAYLQFVFCEADKLCRLILNPRVNCLFVLYSLLRKQCTQLQLYDAGDINEILKTRNIRTLDEMILDGSCGQPILPNLESALSEIPL